MLDEGKYRFHWDLLGDIDIGRPNLGHFARLEVYRLMQFTFRDVIERTYGTAETDRIFYDAGLLAGKEFFQHMLKDITQFDELFRKLEEALREMNIGILRVEMADPQAGHLILTVSEDLDCSGLPELGDEVCTYDEGFIAGILESFTGSPFRVKEVDCWCTGDRTCRFSADMVHE